MSFDPLFVHYFLICYFRDILCIEHPDYVSFFSVFIFFCFCFVGDMKSRDVDFLDAISSAIRSVVKHILEAAELHVSILYIERISYLEHKNVFCRFGGVFG